MTKRLSHERLEEIRELNEKLAEMYGDSSGDRPVIRQLLAHIDALEEEKKERLKWMDIQAGLLEDAINRVKELEKRNDNQ